MAAVTVTHRYIPFVPFRAFHARSQRFALLVCSRRAGKTVAVINDMVIRALRTKKVAPGVPRPFYAYVAPLLKQAKTAAWEPLKQIALDLKAKTNESELSVTFPNGAVIRVFGADNPDSFRGAYFDGVVLDEYGDMKSATWTSSVRPALSDRLGWVVFIGTPKGKNSFYKLREKARTDTTGRWFYLNLPADEIIKNGSVATGWGVLTEEEVNDARIDMDESEFQQEYNCSFEAANIGSYYGKHINAVEARGNIRYGTDLYDPTEKVCVAHDPGRDDAWSMWFWQVVNGEVKFIDYWEESGYDAEEVIEVLDNKPYSYETMWLPHDALHKTARSHKSILDMFRDADAPARKVPNPDAGNGLLNGINAVRKVLRTYPLVFDGDRCARGLEALRNYSRKFDKDTAVFSETAKHDRWSHGADAFHYACLSVVQDDIARSVDRARTKASRKSAAGHGNQINNVSSITFNQAWASHDQQMAAQRAAGRARI